jgi:hypothetical protein
MGTAAKSPFSRQWIIQTTSPATSLRPLVARRLLTNTMPAAIAASACTRELVGLWLTSQRSSRNPVSVALTTAWILLITRNNFALEF